MSKKDAILRALQRGERLTPLQALTRFGCMTLSQRVSEWRAQGKPIKDKFVEGQPYKVYWWEPQGALLGTEVSQPADERLRVEERVAAV